jgi:hypothetical protein
MTNTIDDALTTGLTSGYAGKTQFASLERAGFLLQSSHLQTDAVVYHDEWLNAHNGGGQELVRTGEERATRLYAGGVSPAE